MISRILIPTVCLLAMLGFSYGSAIIPQSLDARLCGARFGK
jgi:hypothetical protein